MKIIDDKGRIFGKINVIDFMVILFAVTILPVSYFGYRLILKRTQARLQAYIPKEYTTIEKYCTFTQIDPDTMQKITIGDRELDSSGDEIGRILWIGESSPSTTQFDLGSGDIAIKEDALLKDLPVELRLKTGIVNQWLYYKNKQITVNSLIDFKTDEYLIKAVVRAGETPSKEWRVMKFNVILKKLPEGVLKLISVGDKEVNEKGEVIAEILNIGNIETNSIYIDLGGGNSVMGEDMNKKQIPVEMALKCEVDKKNNVYFKDKKLEANYSFEFTTEKYTAKMILSKTFITQPVAMKERVITAQVKFSELIPEVIKVIKEGDLEKDPYDKVIAKLNAIVSNKPSTILSLKEDVVKIVLHPLNRDLVISLELNCIERDNIFYFKNYPVKIGNALTFSTDFYSINGMIIGVDASRDIK